MRKTVLFPALACWALAVPACTDDYTSRLVAPSGARLNVNLGPIPERATDLSHAFHTLPNSKLWGFISDGTGLALVGIKFPGVARGVYRDAVLIDRSEFDSYATALSQQVGVEIVEQHPVLPVVKVKFADANAFALVRALPFVDYVEPVPIATPMESSLCGKRWSDCLRQIRQQG